MISILSGSEYGNRLFDPEGPPDLLHFEKQLLDQGFSSLAGVDEAGRGALAGPVVAAAVILPNGVSLPGVNDSKKLTPAKREAMYLLIMENASAVGVGLGDHALVDRINILQTTLRAMKLAVDNLPLAPDYILIDGIFKISVPIPQKTIKKGDSASLSIAAASIVAKVTRDRLMTRYADLYPGYDFALHKGYGTAAHLAAIAAFGPCEIHRKTFRGVKEHLGGLEEPTIPWKLI